MTVLFPALASALAGKSLKYACVLAHVWPVDGLDEPLDLGEGLWFVPGTPFDVGDVWRKAYGSHGDQTRGELNFGLLLLEPSNNPGILDQANETLLDRAQLAFQCVLLHGVPLVGFHTTMSGGVSCGEPDVRKYGLTCERFVCLSRASRPIVTQTALTWARTAFSVLGPLYQSRRRFVRVKMGFHALVRALRDEWPDFRLQQHVRAIEALTKTDCAGEFETRCSVLADLGHFHASRGSFREMYAMRSCYTHLTDWRLPLKPGRRRLPSALCRLRLAEQLSLWCYRTVLTTEGLVRHFRDDRSIKAFWRLADNERRQEWTGGH